MIDESVRSAQELTSLRSIITEHRSEIKESNAEVRDMLDKMELEHRADQKESRTEWKHSFDKIEQDLKIDIKDYLSKYHEETQEIINIVLSEMKRYYENEDAKRLKIQETDEEKKKRLEHYNRLEKFIEKTENPKFWIAIFVSFVVAISTLIGGIGTLVYRLPNIVGSFQKDPKTNTANILPANIEGK